MADAERQIDVEIPFNSKINGDSPGKPFGMSVAESLIWKHGVLIIYKNILDSPTDLANECTHRAWGLYSIVKITPHPYRV